MHMLGANAWNVVMYVGRRNVEDYAKALSSANDPVSHLRSDVAQIDPELADSVFGCDQPEPCPS